MGWGCARSWRCHPRGLRWKPELRTHTPEPSPQPLWVPVPASSFPASFYATYGAKVRAEPRRPSLRQAKSSRCSAAWEMPPVPFWHGAGAGATPHPNPGRLFPTIVLESQPRREKPVGWCGPRWLFQGRGFTKGLARLQVCWWWLGFNEDEPLEANERAGGAVEYAAGKTLWRHPCGRKCCEGYGLPACCSGSLKKEKIKLGKAVRPQYCIAGADGSFMVRLGKAASRCSNFSFFQCRAP